MEVGKSNLFFQKVALGNWGGVVDSDTEEEFPAIHPVQDQPISQHDEDAKDQRLQAQAENLEELMAKIGMQVSDDEVLPEMIDQVGGD